MDNIRPLGVIESGDFGNCSPGANEPVPPPPPADGAQSETFVADPIAMRAHAGRDDDIEAGRPGGARCRETVRAEIPILCYEKEELWPPRRPGRRGPSRQVHWFCDNGKAHVETPEGGIETGISLMHLRSNRLHNRRGEGGNWHESW